MTSFIMLFINTIFVMFWTMTIDGCSAFTMPPSKESSTISLFATVDNLKVKSRIVKLPDDIANNDIPGMFEKYVQKTYRCVNKRIHCDISLFSKRSQYANSMHYLLLSHDWPNIC